VRPKAVIVAHRERMAAEGIAAGLDSYPGLVAVGGTASTGEVERWADRVDAAALDHRLPGATAAASRLRRKGVRVVFIDQMTLRDPDQDEGVSVSPTASLSELAAALAPGAATDRVGRPPLTARQLQVLALVSRGMAGKQVARQLRISPKTVEQHMSRIFARLAVPNQAAAVRVALAHGLVGGVGSAAGGSSG
jgi:DNA-binding CsgD family transcriptional regulator